MAISEVFVRRGGSDSEKLKHIISVHHFAALMKYKAVVFLVVFL